MHVTALDVALASAAATALASIAAPTASWLIAKGGREHEKRLTREARYFDARRSVYEDAITELVTATTKMGVLIQRFDLEVETYRLHGPPEDTSDGEIAGLRARIVVVGSEPVLEAFNAFARAAVAFQTKVESLQATGDEGEVIPMTESAVLRPLFGAALEARDAFERAVQRDMQNT